MWTHGRIGKIGVKIFNFCKNREKWGSIFRFAKESGEFGGFESVGRKSGEGVQIRENPDKIGRVDRYAWCVPSVYSEDTESDSLGQAIADMSHPSDDSATNAVGKYNNWQAFLVVGEFFKLTVLYCETKLPWMFPYLVCSFELGCFSQLKRIQQQHVQLWFCKCYKILVKKNKLWIMCSSGKKVLECIVS